ncbi:MAG: hypothetical protein EOM06_05050 [Sphingobacteriia bacterium]|nr:hypothetical protein [Sphingobacteriia bacterium]
MVYLINTPLFDFSGSHYDLHAGIVKFSNRFAKTACIVRKKTGKHLKTLTDRGYSIIHPWLTKMKAKFVALTDLFYNQMDTLILLEEETSEHKNRLPGTPSENAVANSKQMKFTEIVQNLQEQIFIKKKALLNKWEKLLLFTESLLNPYGEKSLQEMVIFEVVNSDQMMPVPQSFKQSKHIVFYPENLAEIMSLNFFPERMFFCFTEIKPFSEKLTLKIRKIKENVRIIIENLLCYRVKKSFIANTSHICVPAIFLDASGKKANSPGYP